MKLIEEKNKDVESIHDKLYEGKYITKNGQLIVARDSKNLIISANKVTPASRYRYNDSTEGTICLSKETLEELRDLQRLIESKFNADVAERDARYAAYTLTKAVEDTDGF